MTGSGVLPSTIHKGKLYFLFGKENNKEDSAKGFSDFGGGVEYGESIPQAAIREGAEELTGFLGNPTEFKKLLNKNGGLFPVQIENYHTHIFPIKYDEMLPVYYNNNHSFLWNRMNKKLLNETKLFEKIEIRWFSISDMKKHIKLFRTFYQTMIRKIIDSKTKIISFLRQKIKKTKKKNSNYNKTRKISL
jgi:8-oxo-dGTP pyrophosphatase MutT (NUDIX family)